MDNESEMRRLERAIQRQGVSNVEDRKKAWLDSGFSNSQASAITKAAETFIKDGDEEDIIEEEIVVEDVGTPVKSSTPITHDVPAALQERPPVRPLVFEEEEKPPVKREETEEEKLARTLAETKSKRDQEQEALRNMMKHEAEKAQKERDFAAAALEVTKAAEASKPKEMMKKCMRCDKDTPIAQATCKHCGFGMLSGFLSF